LSIRVKDEAVSGCETLAWRLQAAEARAAWRLRQGASTFALDECSVKVDDPRAADPRVALQRINTWQSASRTLVSEMMILAGQVAATAGECLVHACPVFMSLGKPGIGQHLAALGRLILL